MRLELRLREKLQNIVDDINSGMDPDVLASWYRAIASEARILAPPELARGIQVKQDPILWMKFELKLSRRAVPYVIEAIENNLPKMNFSTRLYFQKVEEIILNEAKNWDRSRAFMEKLPDIEKDK
ncbi:MAG: hypothetical protein J7K45_03485 [Thaumarchaeota archaeon]|nr:hypothetical protein [Nitrososphaerota archaeon]